MKSFEHNKSIELARFDDYDWPSSIAEHEGPAHLDGIEFTIVPEASVRNGSLLSGQVDVDTSVQSQDEQTLEAQELNIVFRANPGVVYNLVPKVTSDIAGDKAVRQALNPETELGFHGHHNLAMSVANSIAAIEAGANRIDAAAAGLGAGAGNTPLEVLVAVLDRMGIDTGVDVWKIQDVAEDLVVPLMDFPIRIDRDALTLGYAGVYGSFLLFAKRAEKKYGIPARDLLVELGRRGMVGGQEDMIEDTALTMARERGLKLPD